MQIDVKTENLVPFAHVPRIKTLPPRRRGAKLAISTIHRWRHPGVHGVRLEAVRVGGTWCTSLEALQRFFERLGAAQQVLPAPTRSRRLSDIDRELDDAGIS